MKKVILLSVLMMSFQVIFAQYQGWENYVNPEILSDYVETSNDIWFSSNGGVIKIDKNTLQTTNYDRGTSDISINIVDAIAKDAQGTIWIGTYNQAIAKFDGTNWTSYDFGHLYITNPQTVKTYCIEVDHQDNIWVGTNRGLLRFDGTNWTVFNSQNVGSFLHDVWDLTLDSQGNLYAASFCVYKYNGSSFHNMTDTAGIAIYGGAELYTDSNNNFWVSNKAGTIGKFDGANWTAYSSAMDDIPHGELYALGEKPNGQMYFTMEDSGKYILQNNVWVKEPIASNIPLDAGNLTTFFYDNQGKEWMANGEELVQKDGQNITSFNLKAYGLEGNNMSDVTILDNVKYFVSRQGISTFDGTTWGTFDFPDSLFGTWFTLRQIEVIDTNNVWIASSNRGILHWDGTDWTLYNQNNSNLPTSYLIEILYDDATQTLWCTSYIGLIKFDGTTWTVFDTSNSPINDNFIRSIALDNNGVLYASVSTNVVEVWRFDGTTWLNIATGSTAPQFSLSKMHFDKNNTLWSGSWYGGVYKYDGTTWAVWNMANSNLSSDNILSMISDDAGNIYVGATVGAAKFDGTTWTSWTVQNSGLSYNQVAALAIDDNEKIWFATGHGVSAFKAITTNTTSISIENEALKIYPNPIIDQATIEFETTETTNEIEIQVISVDGKIVRNTLIKGNRSAGIQQISIHKNNLSSGLYYLKIRYNDKNRVGSILVK